MKHWIRSRTLWANALTLAALTLAVLSGSPLLAPWVEEIALANALVNVYLRFVTTQPIGQPKAD